MRAQPTVPERRRGMTRCVPEFMMAGCRGSCRNLEPRCRGVHGAAYRREPRGTRRILPPGPDPGPRSTKVPPTWPTVVAPVRMARSGTGIPYPVARVTRGRPGAPIGSARRRGASPASRAGSGSDRRAAAETPGPVLPGTVRPTGGLPGRNPVAARNTACRSEYPSALPRNPAGGKGEFLGRRPGLPDGRGRGDGDTADFRRDRTILRARGGTATGWAATGTSGSAS